MIPEEVRNYRVFLGKGNNFKMIRDAFRKRFYYLIKDGGGKFLKNKIIANV